MEGASFNNITMSIIHASARLPCFFKGTVKVPMVHCARKFVT